MSDIRTKPLGRSRKAPLWGISKNSVRRYIGTGLDSDRGDLGLLRNVITILYFDSPIPRIEWGPPL